MKKGFTLVELIAVVGILAIIAVITVPIILNVLDDSKKKMIESTANAILQGTDQTVSNALFEGKDVVYPLTFEFNGKTVTKSGEVVLQYQGTIPESGKFLIYEGGKTELAIWDGERCAVKGLYDGKARLKQNAKEEDCRIAYKDVALNGADPILDDGLIPVIISPNGTVKKASVGEEWHNYANKEWANAVLLSADVRDSYRAGDTINQAKILAYFVWIPRYKYAIPAGSGARTINIIFENKEESKSTGNAIDTSYLTHPGFTFGNEELNGIWVGKFENTGTNTKPTILPNLSALRSQKISDQFKTALLFGNRVLNSNGTINNNGMNKEYGLSSESRMMKNSEWGAIAYLSHSRYGINTEIRINNASGFTTGCASSTASGGSYAGCQNAYNTATGYLASTTGNITGVYDMAGPTWTGTMSVYNKTLSSSGFTVLPDEKYYDNYTTTTAATACDGGICYGQALSETAGWYSDSVNFTNASNPWAARAGQFSLTTGNGAFCYSYHTGTSGNFAFRTVIISNF